MPRKRHVLRWALEAVLLEKQLTTSEAARQCSMHRQQMHQLLSATQIHVSTVERLCEALNLTPADLFRYQPISVVAEPVEQAA